MKKEAEEQQSAKCEKGSELIKSSQNETDARLGVEIADECAAPLAIPPLFRSFSCIVRRLLAGSRARFQGGSVCEPRYDAVINATMRSR